MARAGGCFKTFPSPGYIDLPPPGIHSLDSAPEVWPLSKTKQGSCHIFKKHLRWGVNRVVTALARVVETGSQYSHYSRKSDPITYLPGECLNHFRPCGQERGTRWSDSSAHKHGTVLPCNSCSLQRGHTYHATTAPVNGGSISQYQWGWNRKFWILLPT